MDGQPSGSRLTHLIKLRLAMSHHLRGEESNPESATQFLGGIIEMLKSFWKLEDVTSEEEGAADEAE